MKRQKHSLSYYKLATMDMGKLVPVACFEVLPGDSVQQASSALIRVSPLVAPVMHPVTVRIHHWFVPNRLLWDGWEEFITGGPDGLGGDAGAYPALFGQGGGGEAFTKGTLSDYFGLPLNVAGLSVSALPYRAYNLIYNEYYRDQDIVPERTENDQTVASVAWEKDRFTSARPWPQKGPDVSLPLGVQAPVKGLGVLASDPQQIMNIPVLDTAQGAVTYVQGWRGDTQNFYVQGQGTAPGGGPAVYADLTQASAVNVNDVRRAFALQRYQEARAMYGSRYTEYLRYLGVRSSDARLQRPEYLGGGKQTISFTEVLQTAPDSDETGSLAEGVGNLKGHGIAAMRSRRYRRFFEEHGHVLSLMSVRPRTMYMDGVEKMWVRRTKEDYWQRELEQIGQQEIKLQEVFANDPQAHLTTFGWQDQYSEYRHIQSKVVGDFRDTLNFWHMARSFAAKPALNQSFVECDPTKRIHAVQTEQVLWCMISNSIQARRMVRRSSVGRIM